jgi:selenide, water dikinase
VLRRLPTRIDPRLLTPAGKVEDAAAYRLGAEEILLFTTDFFTPLVDDPRLFGEIAAANALSDIYAMGGKPAVALNLAAFPLARYGTDALHQILAGGESKLSEAGCALGGGHTIDDPVPKFGLAVVGFARENQLLRKDAARPGDVLYLTKPLGTGILTTAFKGGSIGESDLAEAATSMAALNASASGAALEAGLRAATDITGYGLFGHLLEVCEASGVFAELRMGDLPFFGRVEELARDEEIPGGTYANLDAARDRLDGAEALPNHRLLMAADAQTSGGLLLAAPQDRAGLLEIAFERRGCPFWKIGSLHDGSPRIRLLD